MITFDYGGGGGGGVKNAKICERPHISRNIEQEGRGPRSAIISRRYKSLLNFMEAEEQESICQSINYINCCKRPQIKALVFQKLHHSRHCM